MATKLAKLPTFGGAHTSGIYSDMTVDGPEIGTLVVIVDRAKNLPNRRSMGKQDPYCAARLGKEAKKTTTDKRGGQTPRWDQELRFTVHDSLDYHNLKVSVFNDDKKTELIGEAWVNLEKVLTPGGGQSDTWHGLNCKGKYAGEIRMELTYYDTRPKAEKPPTEKKQSARPDNQSPSVGGPREATPVKRRPLPSDPTGASPSPVGTPDARGPPSQSGPRGYPTPPRQQRPSDYTPTHQRRNNHSENQPHSVERRRPLPDASSLNGTPTSSHHSPGHQQRASRPADLDPYSAPHNISQATTAPPLNEDGFDISYTAPKPYEIRPIDSMPQHPRDLGSRAMSQVDYRNSQGHLQNHLDLPHSHSAPVIPTQSGYDRDPQRQDPYSHYSDGHTSERILQEPHEHHLQAQRSFHDPPYHVEPLRTGRSNDRGQDHTSPHDPYRANSYAELQPHYNHYPSYARPPNAMQPTVEDEDDVPPPPPIHRSSAMTMNQQYQPQPSSYLDDAPAPLNINRYRDDPSLVPDDTSPQLYGANDYTNPPSTERRYTHPRASPQATSRPVSRDAMVPSPLRNETSSIPSSLIAGYDASRQENSYQNPPSYETPPRQRHLSEPDYRTPPQYETPPRPHPLTQHQSLPPTESSAYYQHLSPQEPRVISPNQNPTPIVKPRATSPGMSHSPAEERTSRLPARSMPTRKSVSPRPPPSITDPTDPVERRMSGVPFDPDSFDVYNPTVSKFGSSGSSGDDRRLNNVEINDKGQVVTFSGRVIDASDHLPLDSWAPEPEPKGPQKERLTRERPALSGARDIEAARQRERDRKERDRIRNAVNSSFDSSDSSHNALVTSRHYQNHDSPVNASTMVLADSTTTPPNSGGRNRLQKRNQRPISSFIPSSQSSPSNIPTPNTQVLRERENLGGYGSSPTYDAGSRHSVAAPPIPAKIPLSADDSMQGEDMTALSLELQSIDIGPGSGGRTRGTARRRFGGY
ncbi:hypothetical protein CC78DRAFT_536644 [Lojkania enalia]|uniref:C2 domain-containing protein n=1 Tax=Lojkania enalia TaxID=147567 RepID=A0A9P4N2R4_9PLEO|nr:hypothetical protein CC78DRAFT_536644 [Didymosphaeria enalia]